MILLFLWSILSFGSLGIDNQVFYSRVCLAVSAIPGCISLLQYMSINKSLGKIIIMIFSLLQDIVGFAVVYLVCTCGFIITLMSLFKGFFFFFVDKNKKY